MDLGLSGRTAIVCGASSGIGLGIAESLAARARTSSCSRAGRELLEREAERLGGLAVAGDVTSADDLERLVRTAVDTYGGIDILVNNSGGPPRATAAELDASRSRRGRAPARLVVRLTGLCLPHLERARPDASST